MIGLANPNSCECFDADSNLEIIRAMKEHELVHSTKLPLVLDGQLNRAMKR